MRRKPVTRSEVRFDGRIITTLSVDAARMEEFGRLVPIHKLFAPLLRSLNRASKRKHEQWLEAIANEPIEEKAFRANLRIPPIKAEPWKPTGLPDRYYGWARLLTCRHCGREFYRIPGGSSPYCSDDCTKASRRKSRAICTAAMVKARSKERAAARADRCCANPDCNKPLTAQRSTMKFCSVRCRVAAHREKANAELRLEAKGLK